MPPTFSGYPADDRSLWPAYWEEYRRALGDLHADFDDFCRARGAPPLPDLELIHTSNALNLWLYPAEVDYGRSRPPDGEWHNLETSVRATDDPWELPTVLAEGNAPIVYLSLGSLGSGDVELMRKLIAELAEAPYRVIVSMGPQHAELELAPNMAGAEFLPQTSILPLVDVVITHGGNNTVTECFHFGRPMVVLPLFWDQYDNAQRVHETGFGVRLDTYRHEPEQLTGAVDSLLAGAPVRERLAAMSRRLQAAPGTARAADLIEGLTQ